MPTYRAIPADTELVNEPTDINWDEVNWDEVLANLDIYPWVVWEITVRDPREVLRNADVAEVTRAAATEAAKLYGCVYEYCVDDDYLPDGTKYYQWYIGVKQRRNIANWWAGKAVSPLLLPSFLPHSYPCCQWNSITPTCGLAAPA